MGYYLLDRDTRRGSYYTTRRGSVLAVVMHVTAGLQGRPTGADSSAEQTAKYAATTDRAVSWHSGSDTDSHLQLLPDSYTAFHVQGYNSRTVGHEISKRDVVWADEDPGWVTETLTQAADCLRPRVAALGIPLRWATRDELDRAIATNGRPVGFVDHSALDPSRRSDPGKDFPRARFLSLFAAVPPTPAPAPTPPPVQEDLMRLIQSVGPGKRMAAVGPGYFRHLSPDELGAFRAAGLLSNPDTPDDVNDHEMNLIAEAIKQGSVHA